jgi:5-methyltetrahydropteroyltriglutamate--homocysteine methyltransferase
MESSRDRILTTHTGSLPRSEPLLEMLLSANKGEGVDPTALGRRLADDTDEIVRKQLERGIDIGGDGELPRIAFHIYVKDRMSGFGGRTTRASISDIANFPRWAELALGKSTLDDAESDDMSNTAEAPAAVDRVVYDPERAAAQAELDGFAAAIERARHLGSFTETFVTAASPGIVTMAMSRAEDNPAYATQEEYVLGLAEELRNEYELIVSRGHVLQLDAPDLAMERMMTFQDRPLSSFLDHVELHIEAINRAVANIPRDRVRLHVCWGNYEGPHVDDVELADVLPRLYRANVGAISLPTANPRHEHDWRAFQQHPLPDDKLLIIGTIDVTTNFVEHPQVVADRICRFADVVGKNRLIASTDCGFGTSAGQVNVAEDVVWAKLASLTAGAELATRQLF